MTRDEVIKKLRSIVNEENEVIHTRESRSIYIEDFLSIFKECKLEYESLLSKIDDKSGWKKILDEWKQKGILN